jgi:RNA polymerase sigma factor (sigma-70 family)
MTKQHPMQSEGSPIREACRDVAERARENGHYSREGEDVRQDAFVRALSLRTGEGIREPVRYILRIARNLFMDGQRRRRRETLIFNRFDVGAQSASDPLNPERIVSARQELQHVFAVVDRLPPRCREAFVLHRFEHLSYPAIARRMGISTSTVEKHITEAMFRIASTLRGIGEDRQ